MADGLPVGAEDVRVLYIRRHGGRFRILDAATGKPAPGSLGMLDGGGERRKSGARDRLRIRRLYNAACRGYQEALARARSR